MSAPNTLFDRKALLRNRARSSDHGLFLHDAAADEIEERLKFINRSFTSPATVSGFPSSWERFGPLVPDNDVLALKDSSCDLIVHGLSMHWSEDPVGQLIQCRRALKPDGLFLGALFGGETLNQLRSCLGEAEISVTGGLSPRIIPFGDIRDLGGLLQRAGFALPVADSQKITVEYRSALHLMRDLRAMGETNALTDRLKRFTARNVLLEASRLYAENYSGASENIEATFEIIFLTGWAPDESQPKPLKPGSATARLSEALGVPEVILERDRDE